MFLFRLIVAAWVVQDYKSMQDLLRLLLPKMASLKFFFLPLYNKSGCTQTNVEGTMEIQWQQLDLF